MKFIIAQNESELKGYDRDSILFVDGSLKGYKAYDHHITDEKINLDAMPPVIEDRPKVVATIQLDTDAICSAVAVYFGGASNIKDEYIRIFKSASMYCDYLVADPSADKETNHKGLGFHLYLKEYGFKLLGRVGNITNYERSKVFTKLCYMLIDIIKEGKELPNDTSYFNRIEQQIYQAERSIIHRDNLITVISTRDFIDPIAAYKVIDTPLLISNTSLGNGKNKYSIGVNPDYYNDFNIKPLLAHLNDNYEEGWGGRNIAGGCPFDGSKLLLDKLIKIIHESKALIMIRKDGAEGV